VVRISREKTDFTVTADAYVFHFSGGEASGAVKCPDTGRDVLKASFVPQVDGEPLENFEVRKISPGGESVKVSCRAGGEPVTLAFEFHSKGFVYSYVLPNGSGLRKFTLGAIEGDFFQVHNFDPDLTCFDIPRRIETPVQISSRRVEYDKFFQLDGGNYMMPPYLLAIHDRKQFIGLGLLDVPETAAGLDARVSAGRIEIQFDYGGDTQLSRYVTPRLGIYLAASRTGVLEAYRRSISHGESVKRTQPQHWWREPIYTSWGDQVYKKHLAEGHFTTEAGSEKYASAELIDAALEKLNRERIFPKTIVIDEGWSRALGDWDADDAKFGGSLAGYIRQKQRDGYRIVLYFNPFLVSTDADIVSARPGFLLAGADARPATVTRSGREYYLFDWSSADFRRHVRQKIARMVAPDGLNGDGLKVCGTKYLPGASDRPAYPSYGLGERYLLAVIRDVHSFVKRADADAPIFLACLNPLFERFFDVVRLGNISEVNHDLYVERAVTASRLMGEKPIDTDDWAAFGKAIGATTFIKALAGVPNIFSAFYRGDGRARVQGAMGGCPVSMSAEQYRLISAAWKMYELAGRIDRGTLRVDYDRMEFSAGRPGAGPFARTYQGGNILAVYSGRDIHLASLLRSKAIIDLPDGFEVASLERFDRSGRSEPVKFRKCLGNRIIFDALSSRDDTWYYHIEGAG